MDTYSKTRIETISESDFWSSIRPTRDLRDLVEAGIAGRREEAYCRLGEYHGRSLAAEADGFVASVKKTGNPESTKSKAVKVLRWVLSWMPDVKVLAPKSIWDRITEKLRDGLRAQE